MNSSYALQKAAVFINGNRIKTTESNNLACIQAKIVPLVEWREFSCSKAQAAEKVLVVLCDDICQGLIFSSHLKCQTGDNIEFTFLTRKMDSFTLSHKNKQETDNSSCGQGDVCDPFSKFRLTLDVDFSVRHAISDLDGWLARADSGLVDDLEKLPYVSAAMQQLKQRKKYWNEYRASNSEKSSSLIDYALQVPSISANVVDTDDDNCSSE